LLTTRCETFSSRTSAQASRSRNAKADFTIVGPARSTSHPLPRFTISLDQMREAPEYAELANVVLGRGKQHEPRVVGCNRLRWCTNNCCYEVQIGLPIYNQQHGFCWCRRREISQFDLAAVSVYAKAAKIHHDCVAAIHTGAHYGLPCVGEAKELSDRVAPIRSRAPHCLFRRLSGPLPKAIPQWKTCGAEECQGNAR